MLLSELISGLEVKEISGDIDSLHINGICYNSLKVKKGDIFVAVRGYVSDGHKYIRNAIENGAVAVAVEEIEEGISVPQIVFESTREALADLSAVFYGNPSKKFRLIGITGTNGKTTTTYLVKSILESLGHKVGLIGTNQNMVGNRVLKSERTTPESLELQELFAIMAREGVEYVVMEISSHSLCLNRVRNCNFEVGAFTNLTRDHLDFHETMDNYAGAKAILFSMCKKGVLNIDDSYVDKITEAATCDIKYYGVRSSCSFRAENIICSDKGVDFAVNGENVHIPVPGEFSVYNALCAISVCDALGIDISTCRDALKEIDGVRGRAEIVHVDTPYTVMIDYAHTPDGVDNIISAVRGFCQGRIITVFGCGGDRDRTKRPIMGEIAGRLSDVSIVTSDNPRTEEPMAIIEEILVGIRATGGRFEVIENRRDAIEYAMSIAKEDDVVLLLGKGHETYQILGHDTIEFDERKIVTEIWNRMKN